MSVATRHSSVTFLKHTDCRNVAICDYYNRELSTDGLHLPVQIPHTLQRTMTVQ